MKPKQKDQKKHGHDLSDAPASQPEVMYSKDDPAPEDVPSQAEGERSTVESDLEDKGLAHHDAKHD